MLPDHKEDFCKVSFPFPVSFGYFRFRSSQALLLVLNLEDSLAMENIYIFKCSVVVFLVMHENTFEKLFLVEGSTFV